MKRKVKTRGAPAVADENRLKAYRNIQAKIDVLSLAIDRVKGPRADDGSTRKRLLDALPTSFNQFCAWTSEHLDGIGEQGWPRFYKNAAQTLRDARAIDLRTTITGLQCSVKALSKAQPTPGRSDTVADLRSELRVARLQADIADRELKIAQERARKLKEDVVRLEAEKNSIERKATEAVRDKERDIEALRRRLEIATNNQRLGES